MADSNIYGVGTNEVFPPGVKESMEKCLDDVLAKNPAVQGDSGAKNDLGND